MSFDDAVIVSLKEQDYRINFWFMNENKAVDRLKNGDLSEKSEQQ